ncbi:MAG: hypothetical protein HY060_18825, partial [Proteobacteria bacterium]|nr:hypothetical protein [Pseudomonadota bacterium]
LAAVALVAIVLAGVAVWRFSAGPISIDAVTPYIERALSDRASGRRVTIGTSSLVWDSAERTIEVRADRVSVFDTDGMAVMVVPEMMLRFRLAALLRGVVAARAVTLIRPSLTVIRAADGGWEFSAVPDTDQGPAAARSGDTELVLGLVERSLAQLDRFRLVDARLAIDDRRARATWVLPRVSVGLQRVRGQFDAEVSLELDVGGRSVPIRGAARLDADYQPIEGDVTVAELDVATIASRVVELSDLAALDLPLSGRLHFGRDAATGDLELRFDVAGGAGRIVRPELPDGRLEIASLALRGAYAVRGEQLSIDELVVGLPSAAIKLKARARDLSGAALVEGSLAIASVPIDDLRKYWPAELGTNPRRWILANMSQGVIRDIAVHFVAERSGGTIDVTAIDGNMTVEGARVRYLHPQPPIEQGSGLVRFNSRQFDIAVRAGRLRGLTVDNALLTISGLEKPDQEMTMRVAVSGPITDTLALLDLPPFGYVRRFGVAADSITGDMTAQLSLRFPLIERLTFDDVALGTTASLRGLRVPKAVREFDLTEGRFDLNLDKAGMGLIGTAQLGGVPATVSWDEHFDRPVPYRRRYDVSATLSDTHRHRLGIDFGDAITGPVGLTANYIEAGDRRSRLVGVLDLRAAALKIGDLAWQKPAGEAASGRFEVGVTEGRLGTLERAELQARGFSLRSSGAFDAQGRLARLDIQELKSDDTDIAARATWQGERLDLSLTGRSLDASALFGGDDVGSKPPRVMTVSAKLDRVLVGPGRQLAKVELRADSDGKRWRSASISGAVGAGGMTLSLTPEPGGRVLTVIADDAGAVLKTFGLGDEVQGGQLRLDGRYDDSGNGGDDPLNAHIAIADYRMVRAPWLAKLLAVTSVTGIPDLLSGEGIGFAELSMQVVKTRNRLRIVEGRASGTALGLTVQGTVEGADDIADLTGTIVPVYSVNRLFGQIPVIGELVTGRGGGLFAFTYSARGPLDNPSVNVNPLSVLAPGFLRNLFHWLPDAQTQPDGQPPPTSTRE